MEELELLQEKTKVAKELLRTMKEIKETSKPDRIVDWEKRYNIVFNKEFLTLEDIQELAQVGRDQAISIRESIYEAMMREGEEIINKRTPTEWFLKYQGRTITFYKKKCYEQIELEILKRNGERK